MKQNKYREINQITRNKMNTVENKQTATKIMY